VSEATIRFNNQYKIDFTNIRNISIQDKVDLILDIFEDVGVYVKDIEKCPESFKPYLEECK
jgi:hypothetical protein